MSPTILKPMLKNRELERLKKQNMPQRTCEKPIVN
jgi:hypothetical protein